MARRRNVGAPRPRSAALIIDEIEKRIARNRPGADELAREIFIVQPGGSNPGSTTPPNGLPDQRIIEDESDQFDDFDLPEPVAPASDTGTSRKKVRADHKHEGVHAVHVAGQPLLTGDILVQAGEGVEIVQTGQAIEIAAPGTGEGSLNHVVQLNTLTLVAALPTGQQFTLLHPPTGPVGVYLQGLRMTEGVSADYTISGSVVTFSRFCFDFTPFPNLDLSTVQVTFDFWYRSVSRVLKCVWNTHATVGKTLDISYNVLHN